MSYIEERLALQLRCSDLPEPVREHRFSKRLWKFDFAWPDLRIAAEVEGGTWSGGRHTRGSGFESDCQKYNAAALEGWTVLRFTSKMVHDETAAETIRQAIGYKIRQNIAVSENSREETSSGDKIKRGREVT